VDDEQRLRLAHDEHPRQPGVDAGDALLRVGGGVAGIQAALDIANAGTKVVLVERSQSIGGHMAQLDKTFPTLDCSACILTPKMVQVAQHPNIDLMTWSEVESVEGFVGNFKVKIRRKARYVDEATCTSCGVCLEKCPKKVPSEFDEGMMTRKSIFRSFPQAVPGKPVIDKESCTYFKNGKCKICEKFCEVQAINWMDEDKLVEEKVGAILLAIDHGRPKVMTLKEMLVAFLDHRFEVVTRRTQFDLDKAEARAHADVVQAGDAH